MQELEKILEEVDKATDEYGMVDYINDEPVISKKQAKDIIRKHMNDGWIPVGEQVPEEEGYKVIVCSKQGNIDTGIYSPYTKQWFIGNISALGQDIIAWRPIPEPYHPEKER